MTENIQPMYSKTYPTKVAHTVLQEYPPSFLLPVSTVNSIIRSHNELAEELAQLKADQTDTLIELQEAQDLIADIRRDPIKESERIYELNQQLLEAQRQRDDYQIAFGEIQRVDEEKYLLLEATLNSYVTTFGRTPPETTMSDFREHYRRKAKDRDSYRSFIMDIAQHYFWLKWLPWYTKRQNELYGDVGHLGPVGSSLLIQEGMNAD